MLRHVLLFLILGFASLITYQSAAFADCADGTAFCFVGLDKTGQPIGDPVGHISYGKCWEWKVLGCVICDGEQYKLNSRCATKYPNCGPHCAACTSVNVIGSTDPTVCY